MCEASIRHWAMMLTLLLAGAGHAAQSAEEPHDAMSYEDFVEAARQAVAAEDAGRCADVGVTEQSCRDSEQAIIEERARTAYADALEERAFRRRQAEDIAERDRRERLIQKLFEDEYRRALTSISEDASVVTMPVGTMFCSHERSSGWPSWATIDGVTHDHTVRLKLHRRTGRGNVENGAAEAVVRRHPLYPEMYELETLTVTDVMGVLDHTPLGLKKTVEVCHVP
jgi:hypothetical protein